MKDLRALAQKIKIVPGSFEEPLRDGGESVRGNTSVGNMVCAEEISLPNEKEGYLCGEFEYLYRENIKPQRIHLAKHFFER